VQMFPTCGLGVSVASDSVVYESDVFAASHSPTPDASSASIRSPRRHQHKKHGWGDRPVLILIGLRLGLDGVNPIYYETIKVSTTSVVVEHSIEAVSVLIIRTLISRRFRSVAFFCLLHSFIKRLHSNSSYASCATSFGLSFTSSPLSCDLPINSFIRFSILSRNP
jgi:hypothetical protein